MSYASVADARAQGAIEHGWVPAWVPAGAYELRAAYDTSGWRRWGLLNFNPPDAAALKTALDAQEISFDGLTTDIPARIEWWPVALRGELDQEALASTGLRAYRAREPGIVVLVNWSQGRAYYWRTEKKG
jgi:hypothetical protein